MARVIKNSQQPPYQQQLVPGAPVMVDGIGYCTAVLVYRAGDILVTVDADGWSQPTSMWYVPEGQYRLL